VLLVGDAAGLVDPVTAEGISHAIQSGTTRRSRRGRSRLDAAAVPRIYQALLEKNILGELRAARFSGKDTLPPPAHPQRRVFACMDKNSASSSPT